MPPTVSVCSMFWSERTVTVWPTPTPSVSARPLPMSAVLMVKSVLPATRLPAMLAMAETSPDSTPVIATGASASPLVRKPLPRISPATVVTCGLARMIGRNAAADCSVGRCCVDLSTATRVVGSLPNSETGSRSAGSTTTWAILPTVRSSSSTASPPISALMKTKT